MENNSDLINVLIISKDRADADSLTQAVRDSSLKIKSIRCTSVIRKEEKKRSSKKLSIIFFDLTGYTPGDAERLLQDTKSIPVVLLVKKTNAKTAFSLIEKGACDFIIKGKYDSILLEKTVRSCIKNQSTEDSLRLSNERYELVSKATNDMVWDWDLLNNRVFRSADGWEKVFGKTDSNDSSYADSWWDRIHPEDKEKSNTIIENILNNRDIEFFEIECRILRNDDTYATVVDRGYVLRNENGDVIRLIGATHDITERRATEKLIEEQRRIRQDEITQAVITAQEHEREELGKELHDNINQILATAKLYIEYALSNNDKSADLMKNAKSLVESAVAEIRKLSKSLMPPSLGEVGLIMALKELIDSVAPVNKFRIITEWKDLREELLSEDLKLTVFRIVQEQLTNISRHAEASKVKITLKTKAGKLSVTIKDNGRGFDLKKKPNGVGLKNIYSRAQLHNGKAEVSTSKGKGCELFVSFKL